MRGETTLYRRIQVLLELSGARKPHSAEEFIQGIVRRSPQNFMFRRWDDQKQERVPHCSESSVRKTFTLAVKLNLVDPESGELTNYGAEAADHARFDSVVRRRLRSYLQLMGCPLAKLEETSIQMLHNKTIQLPTSDELYLTLSDSDGMTLTQAEFTTLIRLLAACNGIKIVRRHLFLPIGA